MNQDPINDVVKLNLPTVDSPSGVSMQTWTRVAAACGLSATDAIELAMAQFAARVAPEMLSASGKHPLDLKGMDLTPLSRLMERYDADWRR